MVVCIKPDFPDDYCFCTVPQDIYFIGSVLILFLA